MKANATNNNESSHLPFLLERPLVRRVGVEAAILFAELAQTHTQTCIRNDEWFAWDGLEFLEITGWEDETLKNAFVMLRFHKLAQVRKKESIYVVEFKLNFYQLKNICSQ